MEIGQINVPHEVAQKWEILPSLTKVANPRMDSEGGLVLIIPRLEKMEIPRQFHYVMRRNTYLEDLGV